MEVRAKAKYIKMSPRKLRLVADVVRGLTVNKALDQLNFNQKWAAKPVAKVVSSAVANAINNYELAQDNLFVKSITVDEGPVLKRWMPKAHGRATQILKKTGHINIILGEIKDSGIKEAKKQKLEAPIKLGAKGKGEGSVEMKGKPEEKIVVPGKEKGKKISSGTHSAEGRHGHAKIEGANKGFVDKLFQRKSG